LPLVSVIFGISPTGLAAADNQQSIVPENSLSKPVVPGTQSELAATTESLNDGWTIFISLTSMVFTFAGGWAVAGRMSRIGSRIQLLEARIDLMESAALWREVEKIKFGVLQGDPLLEQYENAVLVNVENSSDHPIKDFRVDSLGVRIGISSPDQKTGLERIGNTRDVEVETPFKFDEIPAHGGKVMKKWVGPNSSDLSVFLRDVQKIEDATIRTGTFKYSYLDDRLGPVIIESFGGDSPMKATVGGRTFPWVPPLGEAHEH
ncbi:MAG: hypothetical protein ACREN8_13925, partial [Candidatus Dormibacteraceae bacterium]